MYENKLFVQQATSIKKCMKIDMVANLAGSLEFWARKDKYACLCTALSQLFVQPLSHPKDFLQGGWGIGTPQQPNME